MKKKVAKRLWVGVLAVYLASVATVVILDFSLHWGLILGVKILAVIHVLFIGSIFFYHVGRNRK